jgi:hypothetical protein
MYNRIGLNNLYQRKERALRKMSIYVQKLKNIGRKTFQLPRSPREKHACFIPTRDHSVGRFRPPSWLHPVIRQFTCSCRSSYNRVHWVDLAWLSHDNADSTCAWLLACLLACLLARLLACLPACLPACLFVCLLACLHRGILQVLLACLLVCLLACTVGYCRSFMNSISNACYVTLCM